MARQGIVLNSETPSGKEPAESIDIALRKAIAGLQAGFFDLDTGRVNYTAMRGTPQFNTYVRMAGLLKKYDLKSLQDREKRLAFWINLYNTMVIHGIIALGIESSIREKRGFFSLVKYDIGGYLFSPNDIEHGILRANSRIPHRPWKPFGRDDPRNAFVVSPMDVRIHFALVCGSQSCPPIAFYTADGIERQLDLAVRTFVNSPEVRVSPDRHTLRISKIFKWYRRDFGSRDDLIDFLTHYLDSEETKDFLTNNRRHINIRYKRYDWRLNH